MEVDQIKRKDDQKPTSERRKGENGRGRGQLRRKATERKNKSRQSLTETLNVSAFSCWFFRGLGT